VKTTPRKGSAVVAATSFPYESTLAPSFESMFVSGGACCQICCNVIGCVSKTLLRCEATMLRRCVKPAAAIRTMHCLGTTALGYAALQKQPAFCGVQHVCVPSVRHTGEVSRKHEVPLGIFQGTRTSCP